MQTKTLEPSAGHVLAPDGSEVRPLLDMWRGGLGHCTLRPNGVSQAVCHRTIEEIWYFIRGQGQVWRKQADQESVVDVGSGVCLTIPTGVHFQFRDTGDEPLEFLMATMSPWPVPLKRCGCRIIGRRSSSGAQRSSSSSSSGFPR